LLLVTPFVLLIFNMKSQLFLVAVLAAASAATAGPVVSKRQYGPTDSLSSYILSLAQYAILTAQSPNPQLCPDTLEHLEDKFYREGLLNYTQVCI
jgi:hypothetical protein